MLLTIEERMSLNAVLPEKGDMVTLRVIQELKTALLPRAPGAGRDDEGSEFDLEIKTGEGGATSYQWNMLKEEPLEVPISLAAFGLVRQELTRLDESKDLTPKLMPLYVKFVEWVETPEEAEAPKDSN